ncbi:MAG TPA: FGGY family carbohydrate kinase, partial [Afifellaceae bacterium]|nr:FGGY family carbohydrate kinase [Afifellaceae bacterium]
MSIVAIDQGTTSTRALKLEADGSTEIVKSLEHRQIYPQPGWVEHDPEELLANVLACAAAVADAEAFGIDNQGESCLAWDAQTKRAISPVLVWQDSRTQDRIDELKRSGAETETLERAGLPLDSYFSASKLAWIFATLPEAKDLHAGGRLRLGTTDAFFLDRLTGRFVTDVTTASRTSLMNLHTLQWDETLCALFGVPMDALPEIVATTGDFGALEVAGRNLPILASVVDQQAALYGHGCREAGDIKVTFGTGAFVLMVTGSEVIRATDQGLLPTVAWQRAGEKPVYALDGGVYSASAAVNWARSLGMFDTLERLNALEGEPAIDGGLAFVPALSGLACPHWDRNARGAWLGLSIDHTSDDMMKALLEGVAFRAAEVIAAMQEHQAAAGPLSVDGGMSNNPYFSQFLADILGREVIIPGSGELTAIGT